MVGFRKRVAAEGFAGDRWMKSLVKMSAIPEGYVVVTR